MPFPKSEKERTKLSLQLFAGYLVAQEGFLHFLAEHSQGSSGEHIPKNKNAIRILIHLKMNEKGGTGVFSKVICKERLNLINSYNLSFSLVIKMLYF